MKNDTINWRIFKYNIIIIFMLITLTTIIFNIALRMYIDKNILEQLIELPVYDELREFLANANSHKIIDCTV